MNAQSLAKRAYSSVSAPTKTSRNLEYESVARVTHRIRSAQRRGADGFPDLVAALHENRTLWNIFAVDVADSGNRLPRKVKAQIFYLAEFTHQYTTRVLSRQADVAPLLEINTSILNGLRSGVV